MYKTQILSPLDLHLDESNPRFRITVNPSQKDIREYMLTHEDVLRLATKMVEMDTILPGERIIVFVDGGRNIVLEGNRRTCAYQMFLNRDFIPQNYLKNFPKASDNFLNEIASISVDIVQTRKEAMAYLAARHIEGVKTWSSVSKWRISYEYYCNDTPIKEISSILALPVTKIKSNICDYKILLRGLKKENWSKEEQVLLNPLYIKPDKLVRLFHLSETSNNLGLYYDEQFTLKSSFISDEGLDKIIYILTQKAFIDNTINTRTKFEDIASEILTTVNSYRVNIDSQGGTGTGNGTQGGTGTGNGTQGGTGTGNGAQGGTGTGNGTQGGTGTGNGAQGGTGADNGTQGGARNLPYFFQGINYQDLEPNDPDTHGISRVCREIQLFSNRKMVDTFPVSAAFLMRAIIEHSLIYYSKKNKIQGQNKYIWDNISNQGKPNKLSVIINNYKTNLSNYIIDSQIREYYMDLFGDYNKNVNPLNWVVHRPDEYQLPSKELIDLPRRGLLALINYLIS